MGADLLIEIGWKTLALGLVVLGLLRGLNGLSAHKRALVGHGGMIAALVLIPLTVWGPAWAPAWASNIPAPDIARAYSVVPTSLDTVASAPAVSAPVSPAAVTPPAGATRVQGPSLSTLAVAIYAVVVLLFLLSMGVSLIRVRALSRRSLRVTDPAWLGVLADRAGKAGVAAPVALRLSAEIEAPISAGARRPTIILDPETFRTPACAQAVLDHELAHIAGQDWSKLLMCRAAVAVLWFNPAIWMLARACAQLREEAADDVVLGREVGFDAYAALLIAVAARQGRAVPLSSGLATGGALKRRLARILADRLDRAPAGTPFKAACLALAALTLPLAAFTTATARPSSAVAALPKAASVASGRPASSRSMLFREIPSVLGAPAASDPAPLSPASNADLAASMAAPMVAQAAAPGGEGALLAPFSAITLHGWAEIRVRHGPEPRVRVIGGSASKAVYFVENGRLGVMACTQACPPQNLVLEVTTPDLPSLAVIGGGVIKAQPGFPAPSSVGAAVTGGGIVDVSAVRSPSGRVDIMSGGSVIADPDTALETHITDGGSVIRLDRGGIAVTPRTSG